MKKDKFQNDQNNSDKKTAEKQNDIKQIKEVKGDELVYQRICKNLLILLEEQIQLQIGCLSKKQSGRSTLKQVFGTQLRQTLTQISIQKRKIQRAKQQDVYAQFIQNSVHKLMQLNQKVIKIKEFYLYCKYLKKSTTDLEQNMQKYFEYAKKQSTIVTQFQNYLNNPFISDIIFKEYLKNYNVNIFTSDLIVHYFQLNVNGLMKSNCDKQFEAQRIPQLIILQKRNIVFKQLYEINDKYTLLHNQIKLSYVSSVVEIVQKNLQKQEISIENEFQKVQNNNIKNEPYSEYNDLINQKLGNLNYLINKMTIMGNKLVHSPQNIQVSVLVNEYRQNYECLKNYLQYTKDQNSIDTINEGYKQFLSQIFKTQNKNSQKQSLAQFFQQNLIFFDQQQQTIKQDVQQMKKFQFLQQKIIKTQSLIVLNKIFSTFNMLSYLMQQVNQNSGQQSEYYFKPISWFIDNQFRGQFIKIFNQSEIKSRKNTKSNNHSPSNKSHFNVFIETDQFGNWILLNGHQKLIYPSAINGLIQFVRYILDVSTVLNKKGLYSEELMLQILSLKAEQVSKIGEVILNIYNIVKSKQVNCYELLKKYLNILLKSFFQHQIQQISNMDLTEQENLLFKTELQQIEHMRMTTLKQQPQSDYQKRYLQERIRIVSQMTNARTSKFLTYYAQKAKKADFLSQIIYQLDSNYQIYPVLIELVKCQQHHYKTFYFNDNSLFYETVLYQIIQMRNHIKLDHYFTLPKLHQTFGFFTVKAVSFGQILNQLACLSTDSIKVQELLLFFNTQLRLKRIVFKGQLYWLSYKNSLENGKQKVFKQFVQQQAKNILSLSQQSIQYFLNNIDEFVKKVNIFEQQIQRYKFFQIISGKVSSSKMKIKNLENYLNGLSYSELSLINKNITNYNPISQILKKQNSSNQLFSDIKMSIQMNHKIRFQDINRNFYLLEQRQNLGAWLFYTKSFGFELNYNDCFNIFGSEYHKSYLNADETLKILINRQKISILKHYDEILYEDKKNISLAISFYRSLLFVSLLEVKDELIEEKDKQIVQQIIKNNQYFYNFYRYLEQIKQVFRKEADYQEQSEITTLLNMKNIINQLKDSINQVPTYQNNSFDRDNPIQIICLIANLTGYSQKRIVYKIQSIHHQIIEKQCTNNKKILKQFNCLNNKIIKYFLNVLSKCQNEYFIRKCQRKQNIQQQQNNPLVTVTFQQSLQEILQRIQIKIAQVISTLVKSKSHLCQNKQDLFLFDSLSGYKVKQQAQQLLGTQTRGKQRRNDRKNLKKGLFSPVRSAHTTKNNILQNIQKRVEIEMIKQSMSLRKVISKLQIEDKQMKDEIAWQTSKLQHNVINKIHAFITQSNMDQQQSYINFKYTVNLETIKGMQNVIKEQTQLAIKTSQQKMKNSSTVQYIRHVEQARPPKNEEKSDFFLTNPNQNDDDDQDNNLGNQNSRMLNTNIDSIFNHMKKIRIFAAWKKIHRNMDLTNNQWKNFNKNVAQILHNQENIVKIQRINEKRNDCFKQNILCSLLKEQNKILSQKIKNGKIQNLNKALQQYRKKIYDKNVKIDKK